MCEGEADRSLHLEDSVCLGGRGDSDEGKGARGEAAASGMQPRAGLQAACGQLHTCTAQEGSWTGAARAAGRPHLGGGYGRENVSRGSCGCLG